ncbi:hypothetical protein PFISCL1PPCAC_1524, partial [Pristionchus fissidentatus]
CNASLADSVHDLHADLVLSPGFRGAFRAPALTPSMLNKYYEELETTRAVQSRLQQRASTSNDARIGGGAMHSPVSAGAFSSPRMAAGAEVRRAYSGASLAFPTYGGITGTSTISSPMTSPC